MDKNLKVSELLSQACFTETFKKRITSAKEGRLQIFDMDLHTWMNGRCQKNCNVEAIDIEDYRECECPIAYINLALIKLSYIEGIIEKVKDGE